jgi:hypothetical protein
VSADVDLGAELRWYLSGLGFDPAAMILSRVVDADDRASVCRAISAEILAATKVQLTLTRCCASPRRPVLLRKARRRIDQLNGLWQLVEAFERRDQVLARRALAGLRAAL